MDRKFITNSQLKFLKWVLATHNLTLSSLDIARIKNGIFEKSYAISGNRELLYNHLLGKYKDEYLKDTQ